MGRMHPYFQSEFNRLSDNGALGDPRGIPAWAYIRVSSEKQGDDGRSGLPRQIQHIHEVAKREGYCITWERVYADEHTGFEYQDRPALSRLRKAYEHPSRTAVAVVMEYIDRLSRNAKWHQGFLLDEMEAHDIQPIFWKAYHSEIERAVMGTVAQEAMEQSLARMREGRLHKVQSGRLPVKVPGYGYQLVDENGQPGERARKNTYYGILEIEAEVVRLIYMECASGSTLLKVANLLTQRGIKPPKRYQYWHQDFLRTLIRNTAYKGDFWANRLQRVKVEVTGKDGTTRKVERIIERPREEWIHIPVPAIVDATTWEQANEVIRKNRVMSRRNGKITYALTGLVKCAYCGYAYTGFQSYYKKVSDNTVSIYRHYRCHTVNKALKGESICVGKTIKADVLEDTVWVAIYKILSDPSLLIAALDEEIARNGNADIQRQIDYLTKQIDGIADRDKKAYAAYEANVFSLQEYKAKRVEIAQEKAHLEHELQQVRKQMVSIDDLQAQKENLVALSHAWALHGTPMPDDETKRRIIGLLVNTIKLDVNRGFIDIEGKLSGRFSLIENVTTSYHSFNLGFTLSGSFAQGEVYRSAEVSIRFSQNMSI
jgi:site-specific DNA recombinase